MKTFFSATLIVALGLLAPCAFAQSTSNGTTSSNAQTSSSGQGTAQVGAQSLNGVQAVVNQYGADHQDIDQTVKGQVPVSLSSYGSFSQASCMVSTGIGGTTRLLSGVLNLPTKDINCEHIVRGDAQGRAAQMAMVAGDRANMMAKSGLAQAAYCSADDEARQQCIDAGTVIAVSKDKKGHLTIAPVMNGASPMTVAKYNSDRGFTTIDYSKVAEVQVPPQPTIQSHKDDPNWTNEELLRQQGSLQSKAPGSNPIATVEVLRR